MNLIEMFADSVHLAELCENVKRAEGDIDVGAVLLETQCCVNAFLGCIGQHLVGNIVADTYMMIGEPFSTDKIKVFSVGVVLYNRDTHRQRGYVIPFKLVHEATDEVHSNGAVVPLHVGLYLDLP